MWSGCGVDVDNLTGDDIAPEGGELSLIGLGCGLDVEWMWSGCGVDVEWMWTT
jgi:hypothetical protein